ncbi:hypothetical protein BO70DRAFT_419027 [Aspergillus heteromorphus CBS 117.55]|uniref:Uncharacterized protein n=1 Tax=Aspergillus heteromorphus CBS 117.55 TaxID=1448321 RepID=A0A317V3H2_9EURO|nr:uncharacterized protein BO70DRAFT_419027 [Aspergillus heteromorphus CBS 117.55]PWY66730.1 hypothetical protein BO70DRAFT_419027 [Aspergillus heteromorphus CBS 117.55]
MPDTRPAHSTIFPDWRIEQVLVNCNGFFGANTRGDPPYFIRESIMKCQTHLSWCIKLKKAPERFENWARKRSQDLEDLVTGLIAKRLFITPGSPTLNVERALVGMLVIALVPVAEMIYNLAAGVKPIDEFIFHDHPMTYLSLPGDLEPDLLRRLMQRFDGLMDMCVLAEASMARMSQRTDDCFAFYEQLFKRVA